MNTLDTIRHFRRLSLRPSVSAPRGVKAIIRRRGFLDRWQAADVLRCCPSALSARAYVLLPTHGTLAPLVVAVAGPKSRLP